MYNLIEKSNRKLSVCVCSAEKKALRISKNLPVYWDENEKKNISYENITVSISFLLLMVFNVIFDYGVQSTLLNCNKRQCHDVAVRKQRPLIISSIFTLINYTEAQCIELYARTNVKIELEKWRGRGGGTGMRIARKK